MNDSKEKFKREIAKKQARRIKGRKQKNSGLWYGFGVFGIVGWSVMIPFLVFLFLGIMIDLKYPGKISWTITFILIGIVIGCLNAWYWIKKEREKIEEEDKL
jgi:ATP synthase protein I